MHRSIPSAARVLTIAVLASVVAVGCSTTVKETPPAQTEVNTAPTQTYTAPVAGAYTPADLDTDP